MPQTNLVIPPEIAAGLRSAAKAAIETAKRTGTNLAVWRDGKVLEITPQEAEILYQNKKAE